MDAYGIDDLLDFTDSNDDDVSFSNSTATTTDTDRQFPPPPTTSFLPPPHHSASDFTDHLYSVPSDDVAELEWLSKFVDDSFTDFSEDDINGSSVLLTSSSYQKTSFRKNNKRFTTTTTSSKTSAAKRNEANSPESSSVVVRRCSHCASEKTPQWRTGPLGPKTLCNACGVRYKSGRLVPEYRPAASPTFVLTQHSNSHRKVMELRRQKEMMMIEQEQGQVYHHHHHHHHRQQHDFEVC